MNPVAINSPRKQLLVEFFREVWNAGDVEACRRYLAPSYTIRHDPGDPWEGQTLDCGGFEDRLRISRAPFPDQCFEIAGLVEEQDAIAVSWTWHATHLGDLPGFPATGTRITMSGMTSYSFENGRLSGHWQVVDRLSVFQQLQAHRATGAG
jgi:steroid delta-isomerase-like uncharacterized protein